MYSRSGSPGAACTTWRSQTFSGSVCGRSSADASRCRAVWHGELRMNPNDWDSSSCYMDSVIGCRRARQGGSTSSAPFARAARQTSARPAGGDRLPRATAHRLAVALEAHGLLRRDDDGRFCLGLGAGRRSGGVAADASRSPSLARAALMRAARRHRRERAAVRPRRRRAGAASCRCRRRTRCAGSCPRAPCCRSTSARPAGCCRASSASVGWIETRRGARGGRGVGERAGRAVGDTAIRRRGQHRRPGRAADAPARRALRRRRWSPPPREIAVPPV